MRDYELTVVLDGKATAAKKRATTEKVKKLITTLKGKVGKVDDWGVRPLAYKIKGFETGVYLHYPLELSAQSASVIDDKLRVEEEVIRYLLVRETEVKKPKKTNKTKDN